MLFVETSGFTRDIQALMPDDDYRRLQQALHDHPDAGAVMPGTGGLRKLRWALTGMGKRSGARVIYYWRVDESQILMLAVYAKNERVDLSPDDRRLLRRVVESWK
ncbi:MAG: type II toxin-antitoxin system RelE/ParE family toxin [Gammaproteobacteria bacterium]|jgi:mRNA-degrading endonuclease RelE of RelBE toxin-antitoxin system